MGDVEMPLRAVSDKDVAVRPVAVGDFIDLYMRGKDIDDHAVAQRDDSGPHRFAPDKLVAFPVHGEEIAAHADNVALMAFHRPDEMPLGIIRKKLAVNDVNVFAAVKKHAFKFRI